FQSLSCCVVVFSCMCLFFLHGPAPTGIYTLSLHDALPISLADLWSADRFHPSPSGYQRVADVLLPSLLEGFGVDIPVSVPVSEGDRKSTRLNSSHLVISYAVFCSKKTNSDTRRNSKLLPPP